MATVACTRPRSSVLAPLGVATALASTEMVSGIPLMMLRLASSAVAVATAATTPVFGITSALSTKTKSDAATLPIAFVTVNAIALTRLPDFATTVMVRLLRSAPMPMAAVNRPVASVAALFTDAMALLSTCTVTGTPASALRLASNAVTVAVTVSRPVFATVDALSTSTKSAADTAGPGDVTNSVTVRTMEPLVAVTKIDRLT